VKEEFKSVLTFDEIAIAAQRTTSNDEFQINEEHQ